MTPGPEVPSRLMKSRFLQILWVTLVKYSTIDGPQRAASFAYFAFFALFPLLLVLVSIGSYFYNSSKVGTVVLDNVSHYLLVESDKHDLVRETIQGVVKARRGVGFFAVLGLIWSSVRFFQSLVIGVNRAWGTHEYSWWRLPLQNLLMVGLLAGALLIGFLTPLMLGWFEAMVSGLHISFGGALLIVAFETIRFLIPSVVLFSGFIMFYKLAPRRPTTIGEVWVGALVVTIFLQALQSLFILYAKNVANFNHVYGAVGSVIAVLMWVYLSGSIIILGGCYCAARAEVGERLRIEASEVRFPVTVPSPEPE